MLLKDKTLIVTGASSGIGADAARAFATQGAQVVIGARRARELEEVAAQIRQSNGEVALLAGDVTDPAFAPALVALARERFGKLDGAFNNAGIIGPSTPIAQTSPEDWDHTLATNLTAAFSAARAQIPALLANGGGALTFTGSFIGHTATLPGMGTYAASKAGLIGLVQGIAVDYGPQGIRANALLPGGTMTAMAMDAATNPDTRAFISGLHALKRLAEPEEIAEAAVFLQSDMASFVTGTAMLADGGNSIAKV